EINPSFRFELERQSLRPSICDFPTPVLPATTNPPGTICNVFLDPALVKDSNRLGSANLYVQAPRWFILEGAFRASTATLNSLTETRNTTDPSCALANRPPPCDLPVAPYPSGPTGFSRPSYRGALSYKIRNDENMVFTFSFERNNNFYFN